MEAQFATTKANRNSESRAGILLITGAVLFNSIFWQEKIGLNAILFDVFILSATFYLYPRSLKSSSSLLLLAANLFALSMVILHNTLLSKIACVITLGLYISFSQFLHRSVLFASGSILMNYIQAIPNIYRQISAIKSSKDTNSAQRKRNLRILILPIIILTAFIIIYLAANTMFSKLAVDFIADAKDWFLNMFNWFSFDRLLFFALGLLLIAGLLLKTRSAFFSDEDMKHKDDLLRRKRAFKKWKEGVQADIISVVAGKRAVGQMALKSEYTVGYISLMLLNLLLLCINIIDVKYVWLGFSFRSDFNMAEYVHEGAGMLIFSIIMAMLLVLYFFRGNLNFYKKNRWVKNAAYIWIFQNLFLVISVLIRDYYYISHYGLAYKRIGLLFFLLMVLIGLVTVLLKVCGIKTGYYLLRVNAWAAIFLMVSASSIHWDETIAKYNLERQSTIPIDVPFLISLSDKTLPLLEKNKEILEQYNGRISSYYRDGGLTALEFFERRKQEFFANHNKHSWLSWNSADNYVLKHLMQD